MFGVYNYYVCLFTYNHIFVDLQLKDLTYIFQFKFFIYIFESEKCVCVCLLIDLFLLLLSNMFSYYLRIKNLKNNSLLIY